MSASGRFGLLAISKADIAAAGAEYDDLDGFVDLPLKLKGVEVAGLMYENREGLIKVSLRSRERVNVNAVCRLHEGGGHRLASGCKLAGPLGSAISIVEGEVGSQIQRDLA
jgi:phosphoesterase RecJ-like protein